MQPVIALRDKALPLRGFPCYSGRMFCRCFLCALLLWGLGCSGLAASPAPSQPNVVLFLVDDLGWQDVSLPFYYSNGAPVQTASNRRYRTPNLERLARSGMTFTDAYASTVCSPTRVSLLTGMNAARHRVTNWTLRRDRKSDQPPRDSALAPPEWNVNGLSQEAGVPGTFCAVTLAQLLQTNGYHTVHVGKAHWGALGTPGADPRNLGFEVNIAGHAAGAPGSYLGQSNYAHARGEKVWDTPGLEKYHGTDTFLTEALTIEALAAMESAVAASNPFFLHLSHYAVHVPFAADPRFYEAYRERGLDATEAMYAALIEGMDFSLGRVLDYLERRGLATNTFIWFLSDNGGLSAQGRSGQPHTHNAPLRSGKGSAFEGGLRIPMVVRWPGVTAPGSVCQEPVIVEDVFPTVLEVCKVRAGTVRPDGVSLAPQLGGRAGPRRSLVWHYPHFWGPTGPGIEPFSALRAGPWKLIYYYPGRRTELYHLGRDLGETRDLATEEPALRARLEKELGRWLSVFGAQTPVAVSDRRPEPLPGLGGL